ncbi:MAG: hypothetical protein FWD71_12785 [Oscillospiraceae bacterium]|nr:hypothetical protein [Oscillospiraceae bacterium]
MTTTDIDVDLELCETVTDIDAYFVNVRKIDRNDFAKQIDILSKYMCIIGTGNFGYISEQAECMILKNMFISGEWRQLTDKYLRANPEPI